MLRKDIFDLAIKHRLPSFSSNRQIALAGGLMTSDRPEAVAAAAQPRR